MAERTNGSDPKISTRTWIGLIIAVVVIVFIAANQEETRVSFLFMEAVTPLWFALGLTGAGGFVAGLFFSRRRR